MCGTGCRTAPTDERRMDGMLLARSRVADGAVRSVAAVDDHWFDLRPLTATIDASTLDPAARLRIREAISAGALPDAAAPTTFAPPLGRPGKIVCIGLNYLDHAEETGARPPEEPVV